MTNLWSKIVQAEADDLEMGLNLDEDQRGWMNLILEDHSDVYDAVDDELASWYFDEAGEVLHRQTITLRDAKRYLEAAEAAAKRWRDEDYNHKHWDLVDGIVEDLKRHF